MLQELKKEKKRKEKEGRKRKQEEEGDSDGEEGDSDSGESVDLSWLPDPDKVRYKLQRYMVTLFHFHVYSEVDCSEGFTYLLMMLEDCF